MGLVRPIVIHACSVVAEELISPGEFEASVTVLTPAGAQSRVQGDPVHATSLGHPTPKSRTLTTTISTTTAATTVVLPLIYGWLVAWERRRYHPRESHRHGQPRARGGTTDAHRGPRALEGGGFDWRHHWRRGRRRAGAGWICSANPAPNHAVRVAMPSGGSPGLMLAATGACGAGADRGPLCPPASRGAGRGWLPRRRASRHASPCSQLAACSAC